MASGEQSGHLDDVKLRLRDVLRFRVGSIALRFRGLWPEINRMARWLEDVGLPAAQAAGRETVCLTVRRDGDADGEGEPVGLAACYDPDTVLGYPLVAGFLASLGLDHLELDARLESNQIADVLRFVYAFRRRLASCKRQRPSGGGAICSLWDEGGLQMFCTKASVRDRSLWVTYSYCATRMSNVVHWFKTIQRHFRDHRALFGAAPRYALLVFLIALVPVVLYGFFPHPWLLIALTIVGALVLGAIVYLFFMTAGSLEYDNEEKQFRLTRANAKLGEYHRNTQADLKRARAVQQRILPDMDRMPLPTELDWAASFVPEAEVGGDYFDVAPLDYRRVAILFSDVSGHGMSAALITTIIKTTFHRWLGDRGSLVQFVEDLNSTLYRLTPDDSFAALFVAVYDADSRELEYVNCGHNPEPWRISRNGGGLEQFSDARATLLGFQEDIPCQTHRRTLAAGDTVLFVTDGITEARNREGRLYSTEDFQMFLETQRGHSAADLADSIVREVSQFAQGEPQTDDRTVLAMHIKDDDDH